jgi:hypothetical protein
MRIRWATGSVHRDNYGPEIVIPPDEIESGEEFMMRDDDATQWEAGLIQNFYR